MTADHAGQTGGEREDAIATVTPSGRWSWYVTVSVPGSDGWIRRTVARADRIALRWVQQQMAWQQRLAAETHTVTQPKENR